MEPSGTRIRVLRVITRLNVGGPAQQAILLTERLDPGRFQTLLVTGQLGVGEGDMLALRPSKVQPVVVPGLSREISPVADVISLGRLLRVVRAFRPHVIHTHLAKAGLLGRIAARIAGVSIVVHTFHGHAFQGYFDPARARFFLGLERALARMSTRIVAISPRQRDEIRALGIAREPKLIEVPLGIELAPFLDVPRGALRRELGVAADVPLVGIVGRLVPIKAVDVFIEAMAIVARRDERPRFVVVGDGERRSALEALARARGLDGRSSFLGWRADLRPIYGDLDVVALTSDNEGTPVSMLEALAAGRAVIATSVGGVPDLIGADERGLLVPRRDPARLADAVIALLADRERAARLGEAGRRHVYPAYDASTLIARLESLYLELASAGAAP